LPTFTPPTVVNRSVDSEDMLWKYFRVPDRGLNLLRYTDGSYELTDSWPWVTDGVGKVVDRAFYGAHSHLVTAGEAAAITTYLATQGYVANIV